VNKILDTIGNNELKINVDAIDEKVVLDGLQKVANRITLGLVLAALIVGAASSARKVGPAKDASTANANNRDSFVFIAISPNRVFETMQPEQ